MRGLPRSHAKHVQRKTALFDDGLAQKSCEACTSGPVAQSVRAPLL